MVLKTIGITGGSGLLGSHLLYFFSKKKIKIIATYRKKIPFKNINIKWVKCDLKKLSSIKSISKTFIGIDFLILNAATTESKNKKFYKNNDISSTRTMSQWCIKNKTPLAYISGSIVYKKADEAVSESHPFSKKPAGSEYGLSKIICEKIIKEERANGLKAMILRPTSIYGLGLKNNKLLNRLRNEILSSNLVKINLSNHKMNFIHARDIANGIYRLIKKNSFSDFNFAYKKSYTIKEIISKISNYYKKKPKIIDSKMLLNKTHIQYKLNSTKLAKSVKWTPKISLDKGLKMMIKKRYY